MAIGQRWTADDVTTGYVWEAPFDRGWRCSEGGADATPASGWVEAAVTGEAGAAGRPS